MAVVEDFMLGSAHIKISNDCIHISKEEGQAIINTRSKKIQPHICHMELKREAEQYPRGENESMKN